MKIVTQGDKDRARLGYTRQRAYQMRHYAAGLCLRCSRPVWSSGMCFRCHLARSFNQRGILRKAKRSAPQWNAFVVAMMARYERILHDEGFAVDAVHAPEAMIQAAGFGWAPRRSRNRRKVLEVISRYDDHAIRKRFSEVEADELPET